jgi:putative transposase
MKPKVGRPPKQDVRQKADAILYVLEMGCQWRTLPQEFGIGQRSVRLQRWRLPSRCRRVLCTLREAEHIRAGRKAIPSVAIIDLQSVKTTLKKAATWIRYR